MPEETEQEVLSPQTDLLDNQTLAVIQKSEIDIQISTAKKYPRQITKFLNTANALVTQDPETADDCIYALPRDGKLIEGPSARFAEIIAYSWGNCRAGARVISENEEFVTAMGSFIDLEANVQISYEVRRRITTKSGKRYNSDMISTTANAACSIALRNAVLKGVPKAMWKKSYDKARATIAGNEKTLDTRRNAAIKQFELMGAKREQIFALLEIKGIEDITLEHLVVLRGIYNAIKEGETTVANAFTPKETQDVKLAEKSRENLEEIKKKYAAAQQQELADPTYQEKLRAEAERQKKAVAERYGAQSDAMLSMLGKDKSGASQPREDTPPAEAKAEPTTAAPPTQQPAEMRQQAAGTPEDAGASSGDEAPDDEWDREEDHGVPNIFEIPKGKPKRKG